MIHPTQLPPGPEYDAWLEAEARYMLGDKVPAIERNFGMTPKVEKTIWRKMDEWLANFVAQMMQ
jgi:hypothetical protein